MWQSLIVYNSCWTRISVIRLQGRQLFNGRRGDARLQTPSATSHAFIYSIINGQCHLNTNKVKRGYWQIIFANNNKTKNIHNRRTRTRVYGREFHTISVSFYVFTAGYFSKQCFERSVCFFTLQIALYALCGWYLPFSSINFA